MAGAGSSKSDRRFGGTPSRRPPRRVRDHGRPGNPPRRAPTTHDEPVDPIRASRFHLFVVSTTWVVSARGQDPHLERVRCRLWELNEEVVRCVSRPKPIWRVRFVVGVIGGRRGAPCVASSRLGARVAAAAVRCALLHGDLRVVGPPGRCVTLAWPSCHLAVPLRRARGRPDPGAGGSDARRTSRFAPSFHDAALTPRGRSRPRHAWSRSSAAAPRANPRSSHQLFGARCPFGTQLTVLYVIATCGVLLSSSSRRFVIFGLVNLVAVGLLAWLMTAAFISLWCGWPAVTSIAIDLHLRRPERPARPVDSEPGGDRASPTSKPALRV